MLMKRAFVTGASGFIGAAVVRKLLEHNVQVAVLQRGGDLGARLKCLEAKLTCIPAATGEALPDIRTLREWKPDTVFHLGWGGVGGAQRNDTVLQTQNLQTAIGLVKICAEIGVEHFVGAGSQAEYGPKNGPISESALPAPTTVYGATKLSAMHLTRCMCELGNIWHAWLRVFSTYGPGDNVDWLLPSLIRKLRQGQRPSLTPGEQVWDYLHVDDAATAFFLVGKHRVGGTYNLGSGRAIILRDLICAIRDAVNPGIELGFGDLAYRPDQVMYLQADVSALSRTAGWAPVIDIEQGIRSLIADISEA
jgi:nucleoside-diphosphate-sugar epimerase